MSNRDLLELCWGNLKRRKTRTVLSVIGVVVGVFAIVVMLSIGFGLSANFQEQIESFGNLHTIEVNNWGGGRGNDGQQSKLDDSTIKKLGEIPGVSAVTPWASRYLTFGCGHFRAECELVGVDAKAFEKFGYELAEGRYMTPGSKNEIVFGKQATCQFYDPRKQEWADWDAEEAPVDVLTNKLTFTEDYTYMTRDEGTNEINYNVYEGKAVGILAIENDQAAYSAFTDLENFKKIEKEIRKAEGAGSNSNQEYNSAKIYVDDIDMVSDICKTIKDNYGFGTYSLNDMLNEMKKTMGMIQAVLGGIGAISLIVAAIGIANTMVMSVYERTREIGVMKVIGASLADIKKMFLLEAGMIGFLGGFFGLVLSYLTSFAMNKFLAPMLSGSMGMEASRLSLIPLPLSICALLFAFLIGVVSGYAPAKRAMNLSALEGLKNE